MKTTLTLLLTLLLVYCATSALKAQTLVNRAWVDTTGQPQDTLNLLIGTRDAAGNLITAGNTYITDSEYLLITKYNPGGTILWQEQTSGVSSTKRAVATHLTTFKSDLYLVGSVYDSATSTAQWLTKNTITTPVQLYGQSAIMAPTVVIMCLHL